MRNRITKRFAMLAILCVLIVALAAPALAASYSRVYGQTQDRIRVRASASSSATILDNIVKDACVYVTDSKTSGNVTYLKVNYRNSDGNISSGWVRMSDGGEIYVKILSADQAEKAFSVKSGNLPSKKVGTFTTSERNAAAAKSGSSTSNNSGVDSNTIKSVQTMLKSLKYYSGEITGNVGSKTETAIKEFQKDYNLTPDGVAGPKTVSKLETVYNGKGGSVSASSGSGLRLGSTGEKVRNLQLDLTTLGYYWADITGSFGSKTEAAVKNFQEKNNLTADGVAGTKTLNAISDAVARKGGTSAGSSYASGTSLKLNSTGSAVTQLQRDLKQLGYYYADITGNFGEKTEAAVKEFQKDKKLYADGVAGGKTLDAIEAAIEAAGGSASSSTSGLKVGSTGAKVRQLQQDLTALGYYYGDVSGHYGTLTQAAVKKFQKAKGIHQDGIAGTSTLNAIAKALGGSSSSSSSSSLREGDESSAVLELQTMLKELGYYYGDLTGSFGSLTKRAVRQFQDDKDLTVDGVAGSKTISLLRSLTGRTGSDSVSTGSITSSSVPLADSFYIINKDGVRLRSTYSLTSAAKTTMNKDKPVQASRKYNVAGTTWYYITVRNSSGTFSGYVRAQVLTKVTKEQYESTYGGIRFDDTMGNAEILGMIRVTGNDVSIREAADSDSTRVAKANKGDVFYYVDTTENWFQIQSGYWIRKNYVEVMSDADVDSYLGSDSYAGGTYREGDEGAMVKWIQEALDELDYYSGEISGHYGSKTKEAVRKFQRDHDISADGVAGPKTIAKLMEEFSKETGSSSGTNAADKTKTVYNTAWSLMKGSLTNTLTLTDISKGLSFDVKVQSTGNHADVEPKTAKDTQVLCSLYGAANAAQLESDNMYQRRAVVVTTTAGAQYVGSIYAIPHGADTVSGNNFDGQFCLHFKGSTVHEGGGSISESQNHQAKIAAGVAALKAAGYTVVE